MNWVGPALVPAAQLTLGGVEFVSEKLAALKGPAQAEKTKLDRTAGDMEGVFLSMLLKEMRQTLDGESLFGKDGGDVYGGMFDQFMAQHMVQGGGLGLAKFLQLHAKGPSGNANAAPAA